MADRSRLLATELAALLLKYRPAEWQALFHDIRAASSELAALEQEVLRLAATPPAKREKRKKPTVGRMPKKSSELLLPGIQSPDRKAVLEGLLADLLSRKTLRTSVQLLNFFKSIGGRQPLPSSRQQASIKVIAQLTTLDDADFNRALEVVASSARLEPKSLREDYVRWADIIGRGRDEREKN